MKVVSCSQKKYDKIVDENKVDKDILYCITDMTWEELKDKAKEMGACVVDGVIFLNGNSYCKTNNECIILDKNKVDSVSVFVKSYDKMLMIMRGLE